MIRRHRTGSPLAATSSIHHACCQQEYSSSSLAAWSGPAGPHAARAGPVRTAVPATLTAGLPVAAATPEDLAGEDDPSLIPGLDSGA